MSSDTWQNANDSVSHKAANPAGGRHTLEAPKRTWIMPQSRQRSTAHTSLWASNVRFRFSVMQCPRALAVTGAIHKLHSRRLQPAGLGHVDVIGLERTPGGDLGVGFDRGVGGVLEILIREQILGRGRG